MNPTNNTITKTKTNTTKTDTLFFEEQQLFSTTSPQVKRLQSKERERTNINTKNFT